MKKGFISFLTMLILINYVFAQAVFPVKSPSDWEDALFGWIRWILENVFGLPSEWTVFPEFLYYFILPLLGIMVIVYGFLNNMKIFDNDRLNIILAVIIGLAALISNIFMGFVKLIFGLLGPISVGAFGLLFLGGLGYISKKKRAEWGTKSAVLSTYHGEAEKLKKDLGMYRNMYSELMKKYARTKDDKERKRIENRMKGLKKEMDNLEVRLEEMKDLMEQPL